MITAAIMNDFFVAPMLAVKPIQSGNNTEMNRGADAKAPKYKIPPYPTTA